MADDGDGPGGAPRRVAQVTRRPQLGDCRKIEAELCVLGPSDRGAVGSAEDHVGRPGLVDEGDRAELRERLHANPRDGVAHAQAPETWTSPGRAQQGTQERAVMVGDHRSVVEGANGRGLGDLAKEASVGRSRSGEGVKVHVGQCREGERVGGGEGGTQGRRSAANVVDNRGHEASLFCSARRCNGCVSDVTKSRFCRRARCCVLYPSARKGAGWAYSSVG